MSAGVSAAAGTGAPEPGALLIDARSLHASGIGRYLRELLTAWLAEPPFERLVLLGDPDALRAFVDGSAVADRRQVAIVRHHGAFYGPAAQLSWARLAASHAAVRDARAAFFPHWDAPLARMPRRAVVTVHDLTHFRVPDAFPRAKRMVAGPILRRVVRTAARIVCVSHATASDLAERFPYARQKLAVVPNGVSECFRGEPRELPPTGRFLLCVGNQKPHKNLAAAVGVLAALHARGATDLRLLVAGRQFGEADRVSTLAQRAGLGSAVVELGEVADDALHALYAGCAALVFPSRYEGFGLPLVEAMAAGAPIVASSTPAVAEVIGDAAPVFAPDDVAGMADAVEQLLASRTRRAEWIARGRARASSFSWVSTARRTAEELQRAAQAADGPMPARAASASISPEPVAAPASFRGS
ncbi:MAG: glycosyltransferase family 4 protein [Gemmatirosa sp.]